jgi:hypothetical protein
MRGKDEQQLDVFSFMLSPNILGMLRLCLAKILRSTDVALLH